MPIVMYLGSDIKDYREKSEEIIEESLSEGKIRCDQCLKRMRCHSHYDRWIKETGERLTITMVWCRKCEEWHSLLPDFLLPHKHYSGNEIEGVIIDGAEVGPVSHIDTNASESTVRRWIKQINERILEAIGKLKYLFGRAGRAVSEAAIDAGYSYSELEQVLEMAPHPVKCSGNKLGLANIWLRTNEVAMYI